MSYRPSATPPTTGWARRLDEVMRERGLSRVALFEEIGPALGYAPKSRSAFLKILEDREPTDAQAAVLAARYGSPLPVAEAPAAGPDLASALTLLAQELAALREERSALTSRVGDLEAQVDELVRAAHAARGTGAHPTLEAPGQ